MTDFSHRILKQVNMYRTEALLTFYGNGKHGINMQIAKSANK
jgi:hypothetical protein